MSTPDVRIGDILGCFQGVVPSTVASVGADGIPNISAVSVVRYVDDERVAISNQFLNKTVRNVAANPKLTIRLVDPDTLLEYDLFATRLHAERSGELYESMRDQIDAIAEQTGMSGIFRLKAAEVLRVERCVLVAGSVGRDRPETRRTVRFDAVGLFIARLQDCRTVDDLADTTVELLDELFDIGSSMLLRVVDDAADVLLVVATNGSMPEAGARLRFGTGLVGVVAERRRQLLVSNVGRATRLLRAAGRAAEGDGASEAWQSVIVTPILRRDRVQAVLAVGDDRPGRFVGEDGQLLDVLARIVGLQIELLEARTVAAPSSGAQDDVAGAAALVMDERDGSLLLDGEYLIRGVAGRILFVMLDEHQRSGRREFSNRELRLHREIGLPVGNDNLDSRLISLCRRLDERGGPIRLCRAGRGKWSLDVDTAVRLRTVARDESSQR